MSARSGPGWRLATSLCVLEDETNARWPNRDHASDGSIGDAVHQGEGAPTFNAGGYATSGSDHNPDANGVVCALDIDSGPGIDPQALVDAITAEPDPRIDYVIWNRQIYSSSVGNEPFRWHAYGGSDPHTNHVHVSVRHGAIADDATPWAIAVPDNPQPHPQNPQPARRHEMRYFFKIPDGPANEVSPNTVWMGDGFQARPLTPAEEARYALIGKDQGYPPDALDPANVPEIPWAEAQRLRLPGN